MCYLVAVSGGDSGTALIARLRCCRLALTLTLALLKHANGARRLANCLLTTKTQALGAKRIRRFSKQKHLTVFNKLRVSGLTTGKLHTIHAIRKTLKAAWSATFIRN